MTTAAPPPDPMAYEHFPNAPIVEALLDIRAALPDSVDLEQLAKFQGMLGDKYPTKEIRSHWTGKLQVKQSGEPAVTQSSGGPLGYLFKSSDGLNVVQARKDGFTFSRLRPYEDWESLSGEARSLWAKYVKLASPSKVTRIAVRYINRIDIPLPVGDLKEYILTGPELVATLPQKLSTLFFRVAIMDDTSPAAAIITEAIDEEHTRKDNLALIFDIDAVLRGSFPLSAEKLWPEFDKLRSFKNRIFFESLTEKGKELFR